MGMMLDALENMANEYLDDIRLSEKRKKIQQ